MLISLPAPARVEQRKIVPSCLFQRSTLFFSRCLQRILDCSDLFSYLSSFLLLSDLSSLANSCLNLSDLLFRCSFSPSHRVDAAAFCLNVFFYEWSHPTLRDDVFLNHKDRPSLSISIPPIFSFRSNSSSNSATSYRTSETSSPSSSSKASSESPDADCASSETHFRICSFQPHSKLFSRIRSPPDSVHVKFCVCVNEKTKLSWHYPVIQVLDPSFREVTISAIISEISNLLTPKLLIDEKTETQRISRIAERLAHRLCLEGFRIGHRNYEILPPQTRRLSLEECVSDMNSSDFDSRYAACMLRNNSAYDCMCSFFSQLNRLQQFSYSWTGEGLVAARCAVASQWKSLLSNQSPSLYDFRVHHRNSLRTLRLPFWSEVSSSRHIPFLLYHLLSYRTTLKSVWLQDTDEWVIVSHLSHSLQQLRFGGQKIFREDELDEEITANFKEPASVDFVRYHYLPALLHLNHLRHLDLSVAGNIFLSRCVLPPCLQILENVQDLPICGLPTSLKVLTFRPHHKRNDYSPREIPHGYVLPQLQWLSVCHSTRLDVSLLPTSLTALQSFGPYTGFPFPLDCHNGTEPPVLPSLTYLHLSDFFDEPLPSQLPHSLLTLCLSKHYMHPISVGVLPRALTRLDILAPYYPLRCLIPVRQTSSCINAGIVDRPLDVLPPSLECLSIGSSTVTDQIAQVLAAALPYSQKFRLLRLMRYSRRSSLDLDHEDCWSDVAMERFPVLRKCFPLLRIQSVDSLLASDLEQFIRMLM